MSRTQRLGRFLRRHAWSVSLSGASTLSFLRLASELRERELDPFDEAAARLLADSRGRLDGPMLAFTQTGGLAGMMALCVISAAILFALGKSKETAYVLSCGSGALFIGSVLKLVFQRERPGPSTLYMIATPGSFSFPSGHAMGSTCVVGSLVIVAYALALAWPWRAASTVAGVSYVLGVAVSRVYFGVHFPSDVLGGCLAGAAWVAAATGWFYPRLLPGEASGS